MGEPLRLFTVSIEWKAWPTLGSFGSKFKPAYLALAVAKANIRNGILPFPRVASWVRFVIFGCASSPLAYCASDILLSISVQRKDDSRRRRNLHVVGLPNSYAAFRWWDPTGTG